jgi:hypothetical protein
MKALVSDAYLFLLTFCLFFIHESRGFDSTSPENYFYTHASPVKQANFVKPNEKTALNNVFKKISDIIILKEFSDVEDILGKTVGNYGSNIGEVIEYIYKEALSRRRRR